MGLDIAFNKKQAEAAGLMFFKRKNGTQEDINNAIAADDDQDYIDYLKTEETCFRVPGAEQVVVAHECADGDVSVRANKWGRTYAPLTAWLVEHGIGWSEF